MDLHLPGHANNLAHVRINTTSSTGPLQLIAASTGRVPLILGLDVMVSTTKAVLFQSATGPSSTVASTARTNLLGAAWKFGPDKRFLRPFNSRPTAAIRGVKGQNIQLSSTNTVQIAGYAIVANTTST